jgi:hypothetical protein
MIDLENIISYTIPRPNGWTVFGNAEEFDALPVATKDQIFFLTREATGNLIDLAHTARLVTDGGWDPFSKSNFKTVETFRDFWSNDESRQLLKKWLYHRGIAFSNKVFLLQNSELGILTTWKMVLRYSPFIFPGDDTMIFDRTLNWCLFYYHEDMMFFGRDISYDPSEDEKKMEELNERKRKFPAFRHPYL